jgi:hypothetical protein
MKLSSAQVRTKEILAKALFNLLVREDSRELINGQDVTPALLRLMKLQVPELSQISVQVCGAFSGQVILYRLLCACVPPELGPSWIRHCANTGDMSSSQTVANLSRELERFGAKLGKMRAINTLLTEGTKGLIGPEVKAICAQALANLSFETLCRRSIVREDFVTGIRCIAASVEGRGIEDCAVVFYSLGMDRACHDWMIDKAAIKLIVHLATATPLAVVQELSLSALCTLSTNVSVSGPFESCAAAHSWVPPFAGQLSQAAGV